MSTSVSLWSKPNNMSEFNNWFDVAFANNTFVAVSNTADSGGGVTAHTTDPINGTWTIVRTTETGASGWRSVAYGNNYFVTVTYTSAFNQSAISSDNGLTWSTKPLVPSGGSDKWVGVAFGNNVFVATTDKGVINTWDGNLSNPWIRQTTNQPAQSGSITYNFVKFVNGVFVMIVGGGGGSTSAVFASTDGTSWTQKTSALNYGLWSTIAYGNGVYVAFSTTKATGSGGKQLAVSSDLINWTMYYIGNQTSPTSGSLYRLFSVVFANNQFIMVCDVVCFTSTDGITWSMMDTSSVGTRYIQRTALGYGNNMLVSLTPSSIGPITATTVAPTLSNFIVPSKTILSPPFTLTAPTSNSSGEFTYTSSNPSVATVSGSTVTIVGAGSSTITALQAATTSFTAGSTQSTLHVSSKTDPTLSNFSIPNTAYGTAPFTITPPTSNSSGAFSYASSNESVATIVSVNKLNIVGAGTSTITATQAETADYFAGSIDTPFQATANSIENPALVTDGDMLTYFMDTSATCAEIMNSIVVNESVLLNTDTISPKLLTTNGSGSIVTISYEVPP